MRSASPSFSKLGDQTFRRPGSESNRLSMFFDERELARACSDLLLAEYHIFLFEQTPRVLFYKGELYPCSSSHPFKQPGKRPGNLVSPQCAVRLESAAPSFRRFSA